jgi:hypothetical protein
MEAVCSSEELILPTCPHGVTTKETKIDMVTAMRIKNLISQVLDTSTNVFSLIVLEQLCKHKVEIFQVYC